MVSLICIIYLFNIFFKIIIITGDFVTLDSLNTLNTFHWQPIPDPRELAANPRD